MSRPRSIRQSQRLEEWFAFVDICLAKIDEPDLKEVSNRTHLSVSTLRRLARHEFSLCTHIGTIQALGYAAGLRLDWHGTRARISLLR